MTRRRNALVLGIDEAGRGPVMGPLVICGVWIKAPCRRRLVEMGIRDSKAFGSSEAARRHRRDLSGSIRQLATCVTLLTVEASEVDRRVQQGELNVLERQLARAIIDNGPAATRILADGRRLFGPLTEIYPHLEAENRADAHFPEVAAASILAKVERDTRFEAIVAPFQPELGPIRGGGYANSKTAAFLRDYVSRYGKLPEGVRNTWSWSVLQQLLKETAGEAPATQQLDFPLPKG
jgi:ribonuclease HII